jgi:hypothetical protein
LVVVARRSDAVRLATPVAWGSSGLSGKTSNKGRPTIPSRVVIVARRYASETPTIWRSGERTR